MQLWHWVLLIGLLFLITYNPRSGNLDDFFDLNVSVEQNGSREAQSNSDTSQQNRRRTSLSDRS